MVSQAEFILRVITLWFLVLSQFFRDGMGPFNNQPIISNTEMFVDINVCEFAILKVFRTVKVYDL